MTLIQESLDQLATHVEATTSIITTTDIGQVIPPCIFIGNPTITGMTMSAANLEIPVYLVAPGIGDSIATKWLFTNLPLLMEALGQNTADPTPLEIGGLQYPTYRIDTTLTARRIE